MNETHTHTHQGTSPLRVAQILILHSYKTLLEVARGFLTAKLNRRLLILQKLEQLHDHIDKRFLPPEYGGTAPVFSAKDWTASKIKQESVSSNQ